MSKKIFVILFLAVFMSLSEASAKVRIPVFFSDHMVLQQQSDVPVWGWAAPGERIKIHCSWQKNKIRIVTGKDGKWKTTVKTPQAGGPYKMVITGNNNSISIQDILIGEVWLCSGQSNMVFRFSHSIGGEEEVKKAYYPEIRYMEVARQVSTEPLDDAQGSVWKPITPDNAAEYSAVAMYFAMKLQKEMDVPVGIIEAAWGGTAANSWTAIDVLRNDSALSVTFDRWKEWQKASKADSIGYYSELTAWQNGDIENKPAMPNSVFVKQRPHREPGTLYNGMVHPLIPFSIKGVLWYQGETNRTWSTEYAYLFKSMIQSWRKAWGMDFPFYFVQIAPYGGKIEQVSEIMEAQYQVNRTVKNTGMVVTMDVGNMENIHPQNKKPVGERLAAWALSNTYGFVNIPYSGPLFKEIKQEINQVRILFDHVGSGLKSQGVPKGFDVIEFNQNGTQKSPKPLDMEIDGNELILSTENLTHPFIIRYGWAEQMAFANLFNKEGLPASPFRILVK